MPRHLVILITIILLAFVGCTDGDRMRRDLSLLQERNQGDSLLTDSVLAQHLADYFDRHGTQAERLEAHYLLARTWADLGQAPRALEAYHTAAEQADTTRLDSLSCHFLSRIYGQMGGLFDSQIIPWDAIKAIDKASYYSLQEKDSFAAIIYEEQKIRAYFDMQCYDSVLTISERVMAGYQHYGATSHLVYPLASRIFAFLRLECYDSVASILNDYKLLARSENKEDGYFHSLLAQYFQATGDVDSALTHYRLTLLHCANNAEKAVPYRGLFQIYYQLGLVDSVAKYSQLYCNTTDSSVIFNSNATMQRMQHLYDYSHFQEQAYRKTLKIHQLHVLISAIIILFLFTLITGFHITRQIKRQKEKQIRQINSEYTILLETYNATRSEYMQLQKQSSYDSQQMKQLETKMHEQQCLIDTYLLEIKKNKKTADERLSGILNDDIISNPFLMGLHKRATVGQTVTNEERVLVRQLFAQLFPKHQHLFEENKGKLSLEEVDICIFRMLHFVPSEIAALLCMTSQKLTNLRSRLTPKLFGRKGGAKEFDALLRNYPNV